jgi:hypothetical protein
MCSLLISQMPLMCVVHLVVKYYDEYHICSTMSKLLGGGTRRKLCLHPPCDVKCDGTWWRPGRFVGRSLKTLTIPAHWLSCYSSKGGFSFKMGLG